MIFAEVLDRISRAEIEQWLTLPFDQLQYAPEYLRHIYDQPDWVATKNRMVASGVEQLLPASENGFRNVAVEQLARSGGFELISVPGSDKELSWEDYIANTKQNQRDLVDYQVKVANSKHNRARRTPHSKLVEMGVIKKDDTSNNIAMIAFDTVVWFWNGKDFEKREKPINKNDALDGLEKIMSGHPFLVATVTTVQSFIRRREIGTSATIIPMCLSFDSMFDRMALRNFESEMYDMFEKGEGKPWKITPALVSLMHPLVQKHLRVAVGEQVDGNVLPDDFSTVQVVEQPYVLYNPRTMRDIGDLAYKRYMDKLISKNGFRKMTDLPLELRQQTGMVPSGYTDAGLRIAIERYVKSRGNRSVITAQLQTEDSFAHSR